MTSQLCTCESGKLNESISIVKVPCVGSGVHMVGLHLVTQNHNIVVLHDTLGNRVLEVCYLVRGEGNTDFHQALEIFVELRSIKICKSSMNWYPI